MILLSFIWFCFLYFIVYKTSPSKNLFSPTRFVAMKYAFFNLLFILMIYIDPSLFPSEILQVINKDIDGAFFTYTIVQTIAFISLVIGIRTYKTKKIKRIKLIDDTYGSLKFLGVVFFLVGILSYINFLNNLGGFAFLIQNLSSRHEITEDYNISLFLPFFTLSALFLISCISKKNKLIDKILLGFILFTSIIVFSSFGGRKNTLYLIITMVFGYHFLIKPIILRKIKPIRVVLVAAFITIYIVFIPLLRSNDGFEKVQETNIVESVELDNLIFSISYTYIDIFAANYFNSENAWYLKSSSDIPYILFSPGTNKSYLPPVDDGLYFSSIVKYRKHYIPPTPRNEMYSSSWPIENFGFSYANFLIPGVIFFFFLQGRIFSFVYGYLNENNTSTIVIFSYVFVLFNFNFSNLRLVQLVFILPIITLSIFVSYLLRRKRKTLQ